MTFLKLSWVGEFNLHLFHQFYPVKSLEFYEICINAINTLKSICNQELGRLSGAQPPTVMSGIATWLSLANCTLCKPPDLSDELVS